MESSRLSTNVGGRDVGQYRRQHCETKGRRASALLHVCAIVVFAAAAPALADPPPGGPPSHGGSMGGNLGHGPPPWAGSPATSNGIGHGVTLTPTATVSNGVGNGGSPPGLRVDLPAPGAVAGGTHPGTAVTRPVTAATHPGTAAIHLETAAARRHLQLPAKQVPGRLRPAPARCPPQVQDLQGTQLLPQRRSTRAPTTSRPCCPRLFAHCLQTPRNWRQLCSSLERSTDQPTRRASKAARSFLPRPITRRCRLATLAPEQRAILAAAIMEMRVCRAM